MKQPSLRQALISLTAVVLIPIGSSSIGSAHIDSKTITATNGLCAISGDPSTLADGTTPCGAAVYGPNGFTGTITYTADQVGTSATLVDFFCAHTPGDAAFKSFGGTYTLTVRSGGTVGSGAPLGTSGETVTNDVDCTDAANPVTSGSVSFTVPAGGVINYSVLISGVTSATCPTLFSSFNSIRNQAFDTSDGSHAASPSVAPCAPPIVIPEVPFAALLLLTAIPLALWFITRRSGLFPTIRRTAS